MYPYSLYRGAMDNTVVAAMIAIPAAVGWTSAPSCTCSARVKCVVRIQHQRGHSTAAAVVSCAAAQQPIGSPVLLLLYPCINFLVCLRSSSQPSWYKNPCPPTQGYSKARPPERGLLALFVRSGYCCMPRYQRPCLLCTSHLLTAGAPIILLSSEIGLAAKQHFVHSK